MSDGGVQAFTMAHVRTIIRINTTVGCIALALSAFRPSIANATPIFKVADSQCNTDVARCVETNGLVTSTAINPILITPSEDDPAYIDFESAFDSWNTSLLASGQWSLTEASLTPEATITVTLYRAFVDEVLNCGTWCGGAEIRLSYLPGLPADPAQIAGKPIKSAEAVWVQSIFTDSKRNPSLPGNPYLDNAPGTPEADLNPPAYPFQYIGSDFYDRPFRDSNTSWRGDAFLATADYSNRELVVYDGVQWGFDVISEQPNKGLPEPTSLSLFAAGLLWLEIRRRRKNSLPGTSYSHRV